VQHVQAVLAWLNVGCDIGAMATTDARQWMRDCFALVDKDKSGTIGKKEVRLAMSALGLKPTKADIAAVSAEIDERGVDSIDMELWLELMTPRMQEKPDMKADVAKAVMAAFDVFDLDGDGFISADEFRFAMNKQGAKMQLTEVDEMIKQMEIDGDGKIGPEEFMKLMG